MHQRRREAPESEKVVGSGKGRENTLPPPQRLPAHDLAKPGYMTIQTMPNQNICGQEGEIEIANPQPMEMRKQIQMENGATKTESQCRRQTRLVDSIPFGQGGDEMEYLGENLFFGKGCRTLKKQP